MQVILSPSKTIEFVYPRTDYTTTQPIFTKETSYLVDILRAMSKEELGSLMKMSDKLAEENFKRYQSWAEDFTEENAHPVLFSFKGGVYQGLDAMSFDQADITYALDRLTILSGLYGILRPMDLMQPYRLEMGTRLPTHRGSNLYHYWGSMITEALNNRAKSVDSTTLVNLASDEYFSSVKKSELNLSVVDVAFRELRDGKLKFVSFNAKKARGMMANYIIKRRAKTIEDLTQFDLDGYKYAGGLEERKLLFTK